MFRALTATLALPILRSVVLASAVLSVTARGDGPGGGLLRPLIPVPNHPGDMMWPAPNGALIVLPEEQLRGLGIQAYNAQLAYPNGPLVAHHGYNPSLSRDLVPHINVGPGEVPFILSCPYRSPRGSGPGSVYSQELGVQTFSPRSHTGREVISTQFGWNSETGELVEILSVETLGRSPLLPWRKPGPDKLLPIGESYGDFFPDGSMLPVPNPEERFTSNLLLVGSDEARWGSAMNHCPSVSPSSCQDGSSGSSVRATCQSSPRLRGFSRAIRGVSRVMGSPAAAPLGAATSIAAEGHAGDILNEVGYHEAYRRAAASGNPRLAAAVQARAASWGYNVPDTNFNEHFRSRNQGLGNTLAQPGNWFFGYRHSPESFLNYHDPELPDRILNQLRGELL